MWRTDNRVFSHWQRLRQVKYTTCLTCKKTVTKLLPEYRNRYGGYCSINCYHTRYINRDT